MVDCASSADSVCHLCTMHWYCLVNLGFGFKSRQDTCIMPVVYSAHTSPAIDVALAVVLCIKFVVASNFR